MPSVAITPLRENRHSVRGWLTIFKGETIVQATVSATPSSYPVSSLNITITSGSASNIERGAEIIVKSSTGAYKGRLRVRTSGTIDSTNLAVAEVSQATVTLVSGDILYVLSEHRIRPKFPAADETFAPDLLTYTDQNSAIPPLAISRGPVCHWVDAGQTYATMNFNGSDSYVVDPDGGSLTHSWTFPAGSSPASSTDAIVTDVQIPVGEHWVKHTVTAGGKSWTQYVPVRVHDDDNPPYQVLVESLSGTLQEGWQATFNLFESLGQDVAPDGALVVFWVEETIDQAIGSFGSKGHSASKFVGWLRSDESTTTVSEKRLKLTAISAMARLGEIYGASKVMISDTAPADWSEIDDLNVKLAIIQILRWYTTLTEVCDLFFDVTDYTYPRFYEQKNTPLEMARSLADGIDARITCDRNGRVEVHTRPELTPRADRNSLTTTLTLADDDIIQLVMQRDHGIQIDLLECRGIHYSSSSPLFSRYPGEAPGEGAQNTTNDRLIASNQSDLNKRCGLRGAWLDKVYIDTDGVKHVSPQITLTLFGSYDVFDFYREWIAINLDDTSNWREEDLSALRWMVQSITVEYLSGTATVTLQLQAETGAPDGVTYAPPSPPDNQIPDTDWTLPPLPNDSDVVFTGITNNIVAVTADGHLFQTTNFVSNPPTWTDRDISASLSSATVLLFAVDPLSPLYQGTGTEVNGWVVTNAGVDYITDMFSATPSVSNEYSFPANTTAVGFDVDYTSEPGRHAIVIHASPVPDIYQCGYYNGSVWAAGEDLAETGTVPALYLGVSIDPHSAGTTYVFGNASPRALMSGSHGAGWNYDDDPYENIYSGLTFGTFLYMPFAQNPSRFIFYRRSDGAVTGLFRGDLSRDEQVNITPSIGANSYNPSTNQGRFVVSCPSGNKNKLMFVGAGSGGSAVFITENALAPDPEWTVISSPALNPEYQACAFTDPDGAGAYLWGHRNTAGQKSGIAFWDGTTVTDKRGTTFTESKVIGLAGG